MSPDRPAVAADWLRPADRDWERALRLTAEDPALAGCCLREAMEEYSKALAGPGRDS